MNDVTMSSKIFFVLVLVFILVVWFLITATRRRKLELMENKSDEYFIQELKLHYPNIPNEFAYKERKHISSIMGIPYQKILPSQSFTDLQSKSRITSGVDVDYLLAEIEDLVETKETDNIIINNLGDYIFYKYQVQTKKK